MKVSVYQMDVVPGQVSENCRKVEQWIQKTMREDVPDILVLPELWSTCYAYDILPAIADHDGQQTSAFLSRLAAQYHVNIVGGSVANIIDGKIYNTAMIFGRDGSLVYRYNKIHLASTMSEHLHFAPSPVSPEIFVLDGVKMGINICYDLRFPETTRSLALEGAEVIFFVAAWPLHRIEHWIKLMQARAIESQTYVVGCNRIGLCNGLKLGGNCMIYDPYGNITAQSALTTEDTLTADLDLSQVGTFRELVPTFSDRHPEVYRYL